MIRTLIAILSLVLFWAGGKSKTTGSIERIDPELNSIISENAYAEIISEKFRWSEGPLWVENQKMLLFSDVPTNTIYKWTEENGKEVYLKPSGYTGTISRGGLLGSNGLLLNKEGKLVICQHGNRQLAWMNADLANPKPLYKTITATYQSKKFNSPNDAVCRSNGDIFFTDPAFGFEKGGNDPLQEIFFNGVYKVTPSGEVKQLTDSLSPNGIAFMPGEKTLIISNTDPDKMVWYAYDLNKDDSLINPRIFYNATSAPKSDKGHPDGIKIDKNGNVFATGPGGVWIFNKDGKLLGKIKIPKVCTNCALSADEKTLYITAATYVVRIKMR